MVVVKPLFCTNVGILLTGTIGTNFSEILISIHGNAFQNVLCKMAAILSRPQCIEVKYFSCSSLYVLRRHRRDANYHLIKCKGCVTIVVGWFFCRQHFEKRIMMTSSNGNIFRVTGPMCGEFTDPGEFPTQRPVTRSFDVCFDLRLNKQLSKQSWGWWFETPSWSLCRRLYKEDLLKWGCSGSLSGYKI